MIFSNQRLQRRGLWLNPLVGLAIAIVICVGVPLVSQTWNLPRFWREPEALNTAWGALAGLVLGFWLHRTVSELPGTQESSGILPGYLTSFGLVLIGILMFRIDYSRSILALSFVLTVIWFFLVYVVTQRRSLLRLGVVAGGQALDLFKDMAGVEAVRLKPDQWPEDVDAVTADFRFNHNDAWEARLADFTLAGIPVYHSKDLYESLTGRADLEHLSENTFGTLGPMATLLAFKQVTDRLLAVPALIVLAPLFVVVAIAIKLDSPGPVLFRQVRAGYRGKEFRVVKFRTMRPDQRQSPREVDSLITQENDRRITDVGRLLRRTRIDELPQIVNILLGQMSFIGPRPEAAKLSEWYVEEIPFYRYRHVVRPGITGWAQVNQGHVAEIADIKRKLQYDFYYIRNFSLWLDLLIIMKTVKTVFTGFGSK